MWEAADRVYPGRVFRDYALLGDDIVIADRRVAHEYKSIMATLDVGISDIKSLVSNDGAEFAKKFRVRKLTVDASPVSIKNLLGSHHPLGVMAVGWGSPKCH